jgi:hypothetical protein
MEHERYITRQEILDALQIGYPLFRKLRNQGGPAPRGTGKSATWPLYAWCEWLVNRRSSGPRSRELAIRAAEILRDRDGTLVPEIIEPVTRETGNQEIGLEAALERLRQAEQATFAKWQESFNANRKESPVFFKDWQTALDLLRKAEKNLTDHLTQRRDLLPALEVKTWLARKIEATKSTLLDMPGKVSPELEGLPWPEIQKRLTEEVRDALGKLQDAG